MKRLLSYGRFVLLLYQIEHYSMQFVIEYLTAAPHLAPVEVGWQLRELPEQVVGHIVHKPLEAFALQPALQLQLLSQVTSIQVSEKHGHL